MTIYIDVVFVVNLFCGMVLLYTTAILTAKRYRWKRLFFASFVMSLLHCLSLWFRYYGNWIWTLCLMLIGTYIAFRPKTISAACALLFGAGVSSFLLAGVLTALYATTNIQTMLGQGMMVRVWWMKWQSLLWGGLLFVLVVKQSKTWLEKHIKQRNHYCSVTLIRDGKTCHVRGFYDTGNGLRAPNGQPLPIVELGACLKLFSKECVVKLLTEQQPEQSGFLQVPFSALGTNQGMLWVCLMDTVHISDSKNTKNYHHVFVGLSMTQFSGAYDMLIPPSLLEEEFL